MVREHGSQLIVVSTWWNLYDDEYDYHINAGIVECEPEDCIYMFLNSVYIDEGAAENMAENCIDLFNAVGESFYIN